MDSILCFLNLTCCSVTNSYIRDVGTDAIAVNGFIAHWITQAEKYIMRIGKNMVTNSQ